MKSERLASLMREKKKEMRRREEKKKNKEERIEGEECRKGWKLVEGKKKRKE